VPRLLLPSRPAARDRHLALHLHADRREGARAGMKPPSRPSRQQIQRLFIRVCRDSGFALETAHAAAIAARAAGISPIGIWIAIGALRTMDRIASGEHPAAAAA